MDSDHRRGLSLGEEKFFNRIISRNSSLGRSSRIYYYRSSEGIPFNWEMQPGKPKEPRNEDILPPINPPPALLSLGLPRPRVDDIIDRQPKQSVMKLGVFKFWKQGERSRGNNKNLNRAPPPSDELSSSDDGEFMATSPPPFSSSSTSSSFSFSNGSPSPSTGSSLNMHYGCGPLKFSSIFGRGSRSRLR